MNREPIVELRKKYKRNHILNIIRYGKEISRFEVKKTSRYSMTTVLDVVDSLLKENLIYEEECGESRVGRKPLWLRINPDGGYFIGVEFNAENMYCVVLNFTGSEIYSKRICLSGEELSDTILGYIKDNISDALKFLGSRSKKVYGIGIGVPGYVDKENGIGIYYAHLKNWENVKIKDAIEKEFNLKVYIENNVNAMALAYKWFWCDEYYTDFLFVFIRTGVRMSCVLNNTLYFGLNGTAGEIGHIRVQNSNRMCSCGKRGCLDTEVSNRGIRNKLIEGIAMGRFRELTDMAGNDMEKVNIYTFVESVKAGHADSLELLGEIAGYIGDALSTVVNVLNPPKIVLSGEIFKTGRTFMGRVKGEIREKAIFVNYSNLLIKDSIFEDNIGAVGAAALVIQQEFEALDKPI